MINYLILHLLFIVYALNTVLGRMAAPYGWTDWRRFALLAGVLFLLGIYAAGDEDAFHLYRCSTVNHVRAFHEPVGCVPPAS